MSAAPSPGVALDRATLGLVVDDAKRAPSSLNTQPARWRAIGDTLELLEDPARRLLAADPAGAWHRLSLGAAWEGTRLALGARGLRLVDEIGANVADGGVVLQGRVVEGGSRDPLSDHVHARATWRGPFVTGEGAPTGDELDRLSRALTLEGALSTSNRAIVADAANAIDRSALEALLHPRVLEETVGWMRLTRDHTSYARDGVNLEALTLGSIEGAVARVLLQPRAFALLTRVGLARALVSERRVTASASALVAITAPRDEPELLTGARLYRAWLRVAAAGLCLCPLGAITSDDEQCARFAKLLGVAPDRKLSQLWRVGRAPEIVPPTPRLPTEELLL